MIQLGHEGDRCPQPSAINRGFTVVDTTGVHTINLAFCNCLSPLPLHERTQLLRASWLPASWDRPQTAFTFDMLNSFQLLNVQGKTSAFDFYEALERKLNGAGLYKIQVSHCVTVIG